jgi:radical SAM superfamily enzyme YgiQ (UPF0313 family)
MILVNSSPKDALKIFQPFLPISIPFGVGFLVAACREQGIDVRALDEQVDDDILGAVAEHVKTLPKPYIFGFSVLTVALRSAVDASRELKRRYPDCVIVFGGIHPSAKPDEVLAFGHVDLVLRGEGEKTLVELYRRIKAEADYSDIPGLSYKVGAEVRHNPPSGQMLDLDSLPPFPYDLFERGKYDLGFIHSSRGCPHNCIFCSNQVTTGKRYRFNSPDRIVETLQMLHDTYGQRFVLFLDDNLLVSKRRIYELIGKIKDRGLHERMTFSFQARGDNVDRELLQALFDAGFKSVFFGMETASERLMRIIKKGETVEQCVKAARMAKEIGFLVSATFIFGLPGETRQDRLDAIRLARDLRLDQVRFNNATPYPGTELYDIAQGQGRLNVQGLYENFLSVSTFIENPFKRTPFCFIPEGASEAEIRDDILFGYLAFYWDFRKLKEIIFKPKQGPGWFKAGDNILGLLRKIPALAVLFFLLSVKFGRLFLRILAVRNTAVGPGDLLRLLAGRY